MSKHVGKAYHPINGSPEDIWEGFSWPCLFLGSPIWFLYKRMWSWGVFTIFLVLAASSIHFLLLIPIWLILPSFANPLHANSLRNKGYLNEKEWIKKKHPGPITVRHVNQPQREAVSIADELAKLVALKEQGVLTEEEFNKQKHKLLQQS